MQTHIESVRPAEDIELMRLGGSEPAGVLQVSSGVDADYAVGTGFEFMYCVAASAHTPAPRRPQSAGRSQGRLGDRP